MFGIIGTPFLNGESRYWFFTFGFWFVFKKLDDVKLEVFKFVKFEELDPKNKAPCLFKNWELWSRSLF